MFFLKKSKGPHSFSFLGVDMHNHVLPGLDDGAPNLETSLELINDLGSLGFSRLIPTPHSYMGLYPNTKETISGAFDHIQKQIQHNSAYPELLSVASEYMIDGDFRKYRDGGSLLSFGQSRVLIEMSFADESSMILDEIFQIQLQGLVPVLAHPERYPYRYGDRKYFKYLISLGCELQLNLLSLTDHYGKGPKKTAEMLMSHGLYSWAGTDVHHAGHIEMLRNLLESRVYRKLVDYPFKNKELLS